MIFLFVQMGLKIYAQTEKPSFQLDTDETGANRLYRARNYIVLRENFRYQASNTSASFRACIDTTLVFYIKSISNPRPDSIPNPNYDPPYVPGGSFGNDSYHNPLSSVSPTYGNAMLSLTYPVHWFKTMPLSNNLNGYYCWKEVMGSNVKMNKVNATGNDEEFFVDRMNIRAFNFNPAIDLSTTVVSNKIKSELSSFSQSTTMGVWAPKQNIQSDQFVFAIHGRRDESLIFTKEKYANPVWNNSIFSYGNDSARNFVFRNIPLEKNDSLKFKESALRISTVYKSNPPHTDIWGEGQQSLIQIGGVFDTTRVTNITRFNPAWHNYPAFKGYTPELLLFNKILSSVERDVFETYLAIKYGITLDKSYINRKAEVIWDRDADQNFHNRVFAYAREDELGLHQNASTTACEESPNISTSLLGDSYQVNDSYNYASENKLIVIGSQPGNSLLNGQYYVFGDNADSLVASVNLNSGYRVLKRKWKLRTNHHDIAVKPQNLSWSINDLIMENTVDPFRFHIKKAGDKQLGYARTNSVLIGKEGYFSWNVGQEYGPLTVKFGVTTNSVNSHEKDYGFHITRDGQVKFVNKGIVNSTSLFTVEKGQKMEIEKHDRLIYLRVNGIRYRETELIIDSADVSENFYGSVIIDNNPFDVWLNNFKVGGFHENGHRIELSYSLIPDLAPHMFGNTYLIVDKSGVGNFDAVNTDYYVVNEVDIHRKKIIFDNVFWDIDKNYSDVFTFGFNISNGQSIIKRPFTEDSEPELVDEIKVYYPDPANLVRLIVKVQTQKPTPAKISIFDITGRMVLTRELPEGSGTRYEEINLPTNGVFIVRVVTNEKKHSQKVISKK